MRPPRPLASALLAALLASWAAPARAGDKIIPEKPKAAALPKPTPGASKPKVEVSEETRKLLAALGWKVQRDGGLYRADPKDKSTVSALILDAASFAWKDGRLIYEKTTYSVEPDTLGPILRGLSVFDEAAAMDDKAVGQALAGWGVPPAFDGNHILNPNGTATYYGLMLYRHFVKAPESLKRLSRERLAEALRRLDDVYDQGLRKQAPDIALDELELIDQILDAPARPGETAMALKPYPDLGPALARYRKMIQADMKSPAVLADPGRRTQNAEALAALDKLRTQRYSTDLSIIAPPDPNEKPSDPPVSLSGGMPALLSALERVNGKPLSPEQQESLIKSFPMGELVWRLGAQNLWREGLTGRGVKVAVVDEGVAPHPELDAVVKDRQNFTFDRGAAMNGDHGTHVAGIIHSLAPEAEIRSYAALVPDGGNKKLAGSSDDAVIAAVRKAVADGNQIVNMSLAGNAPPSDAMSRLVDEYSKQGVIFVISAGNDRGDGGIHAPSNAVFAQTVGSLNENGRMSDFSQFGANYDPQKLKHVIKSVFMLPGDNINSTVSGGGYEKKSGTSMAAPADTGVNALLLQSVMRQAADFHAAPDPVTASRRIWVALNASATPMDLRTLPPGVPMAQTFLVVDPLAALRNLQSNQAPVAGSK